MDDFFVVSGDLNKSNTLFVNIIAINEFSFDVFQFAIVCNIFRGLGRISLFSALDWDNNFPLLFTLTTGFVIFTVSFEGLLIATSVRNDNPPKLTA